MASSAAVVVVAETESGKITSVTLELLGCARGLADKVGGPVVAALAGNGVKALGTQLIAAGADQVLVADNPALNDYSTDSYLQVMEQAVRQSAPQIVLLGQTAIGRDLAPRLAFRLDTGLATDCIDLDIDPQSKGLLATRPVYGGNARATFTIETRPQVATVRAKVMSPLPPNPARSGQVVSLDTPINTPRSKLVEKVKEEVKGVKLEDAEVVVSGGRGIGGSEGFQQLVELANILRGAVGATRAACDNSWWPATAQVGLTGKIVVPTLYIAVALSGSSQHMAGCSGAKTIVAINKDPEANIFKESQLGVVGDYRQVLPAFTAKVRQLVSK